tara:strand:- start:4553 stop:5428 length:876 start_codon:yes stop_codon:yes gene_type:complete
MTTRLLFVLWVSLHFLVPTLASARIFTDDTGRTVEADLVGVQGDDVVISKNGKAARWPIAKLSKPDQIYVSAWAKNPPQTPRLRVRLFERDGVGPSGVFQGETGKAPVGIPILQQTEATANYKHYEADIANDSNVDATQVLVSYMLFIVNLQNQVVAETGAQSLNQIAAGTRETVATEGITYLRTKTTSLTLGTNPLGNLNLGSDTSRNKERFGGAWVRTYSPSGELLGEARNLIPEIERLNPAWQGSTGEREFPLLEALNAFEKLLENLPELPKPPAGLPKPPKPPFGPK